MFKRLLIANRGEIALRVVEVHAKAGDKITAGGALVVLEAMKMEHTLAAPAALRVTGVYVAKGAQVAPGKLLMEFEPARAKRPPPVSGTLRRTPRRARAC